MKQILKEYCENDTLARLEYIHCAIQELYLLNGLNVDKDMLFQALEYVEDLREPYLKERK